MKISFVQAIISSHYAKRTECSAFVSCFITTTLIHNTLWSSLKSQGWGWGMGSLVNTYLIGLSISKQHDGAKRNVESWLLPVVSLITDGVQCAFEQFNAKVNNRFSTLKRLHLNLDRAMNCTFVCGS